ncbi:hypothetical protein QTJ16_003809 [Diplocarpon rosae]|uniref:CUE domain-containing protein n=1 Tax=Diplocarpon rosae TaxID=946125 RepID=A0AAD9T130_9HELO|nr:hypothetical protein QTJ16_003809 [Diplocarpon rosae]
MSTEEIEEAVNALKEVYVYCTKAEINNAIVIANGNLNEAGIYLHGERATQSVAEIFSQGSVEEDQAKKDDDEAEMAKMPDPETADKIRRLLQIFPGYSVSLILDALKETYYDPEHAAMSLANALPPPPLDLRQDGPSNRKGKNTAFRTCPRASPQGPAALKHESGSDSSPVNTPRTTASLSPQTGTSHSPSGTAGFERSLDYLLDGSYNPWRRFVDGMCNRPTLDNFVIQVAKRRGEQSGFLDADLVARSSGDEDFNGDWSSSKLKIEAGSGQTSLHQFPEKSCESKWQELDLDKFLDNKSSAVSKRPPIREAAPNSSLGKKIDILTALFPGAGKSRCESELRLAQGNVEEAFEDLEDEFGIGGEEAQEIEDGNEGEDEDGHNSADLKSPCEYVAPRKSQALKRSADVSDEHRARKRARREHESADEQEENAGLETASQWVKSTLQSNNEGVTIFLDSGPHPCRISERLLGKIPLFATHFDSEGQVAGLDASLRVRNVSEATFDLAMQYAVCHNGRVEPAQATSKSCEITALVDLAIFASQVGLRLGPNTSPFMVNLKALLVDHSEPLLALHISRAFEHLEDGHRVRSLFVKAAFRSYAIFNISGQHIRRAGSDAEDSEESDASDPGLNSAQKAFYRTSKFRYHREFKRFQEFRLGLYEEFHAAWWKRTVHDIKYGKIRYDETEIVDPLTKKRFIV